MSPQKVKYFICHHIVMVGIEGTLKLMGTPRLNGSKLEIDVARDLERSQRAEQNIERMKEMKKKILDRVSRRFRIDAYCSEEGEIERELVVEGVKVADIKGEVRYKRTPYKQVAEGMESHLQGLAFHFNRGRWLTDVVRRDGQAYVHAGRLMEDFDIILAGHLGITVECNVVPAIEWREARETLIIPGDVGKRISASDIRLLAQIGYSLPLEESYLKAYRRAAAKGAPKKGVNITEVSSKKAVEGGTIEKETVDWTAVVRTLIPVPTRDDHREWDPEIPYLFQIDKQFGPRFTEVQAHYELSPGVNGERPGTYVSVRTAYERMQQLKEEFTGKTKEHFAEVVPVLR